MFPQSPRKTRPRKELLRIAVVFRGRLGDDLLQVDGELVWIERATFPYFLSRRGNFIPWFHVSRPYGLLILSNSFTADCFSRTRLAYATGAKSCLQSYSRYLTPSVTITSRGTPSAST